MRTRLVVLALAAWLEATPALASSLPPPELEPGEMAVGAGFPYVAVDRGLAGGWTLGAVGWNMPNNFNAGAVRAGYGLWHGSHLDVGVLASAGLSNIWTDPHGLGVNGRWDTRGWLQPAVNVSLALFPPEAAFNVRLRATAGPLLMVFAPAPNLGTVTGVVPGLDSAVVLPSVEIAVQPFHHVELSVGYPELFGVRGRW